MSKETKDARKRTSAGQILARIFCALLGLCLGCALYIFKVLGGFTYVSAPVATPEDYQTIELTIDNSLNGGDVNSSWSNGGHTRVYVDPNHPIISVPQKDKNVENILVFGVDSRGSDDYKCRSDAMIVVSINKNTNTIKLISLMRDTGVYIGDTKETQSSNLDKLTHAYAYGGVGLMINTINVNFDLDIQRFVMLDFNTSSDIIDLVGGIDIDVSSAEVEYANSAIAEMNTLVANPAPYISNGGLQTLSGVQAIGWSRIRHLDSDFVRTSRQRTVATALINKITTLNRLQQLAVIEDSAGMFETNMQTLDLARIGANGVSAGSIDEYRVPEDNLYRVQENPWMMIVDMDQQIPLLHQYIWG